MKHPSRPSREVQAVRTELLALGQLRRSFAVQYEAILFRRRMLRHMSKGHLPESCIIELMGKIVYLTIPHDVA